ncbi:MAG TPA: aromatic ring-hydroxylating dioxygenase subunit alpha [Candidatus Binataceae bacterium]|nr:aromatic ring-hydroxylating dioxygenase subunit alpha [Candidatus Binataceae bacterium]
MANLGQLAGGRKDKRTTAMKRPAPIEKFLEEPLNTAERIPKERYTSRKFARLELEKMWPHVWQLACRETDVANPGDYYEYRIGEESILIIREQAERLRAFYNVCQHRGNRLREGQGNCHSEIRCPYHWWCYNLDGSLKNVPDRFDLEEPIQDADYGLKQVLVDTWGGFVWINMDPQAEPLLDYLTPVPEQVAPYQLENWVCTINLIEVVATNWKNPQDNFLEIYHFPALHSQASIGGGWGPDYGGQSTVDPEQMVREGRSQVDLYKLHSRRIFPQGVTGSRPWLRAPDDQALVKMMAPRFFGADEASREGVSLGAEETGLPPGMTARQWLMRRLRGAYEAKGLDLSRYNDSQIIDRWSWHVFPNIVFTLTPTSMFLWRVRPNGNDPNSCIQQLMEFRPLLPGEKRPRDAEEEFFEQGMPPARYQERRGQNGYAYSQIMEQDYVMFCRQQKGMRSNGFSGLRLTAQERRIRKVHEVIDSYLEREG